MYMKNDEMNFILTFFLIFLFYVLCEEEEKREKRGERQNIMKKNIFIFIFNSKRGKYVTEIYQMAHQVSLVTPFKLLKHR